MPFTARYAHWRSARGRTAAAIVGSLVCLAPVHSQDTGIDPGARALLERTREAYRSVEALHVKVSWTAQYSGAMTADDFPLPGPDTLEVRMRRPNRFYMSAASRRDGQRSSYVIASDGVSLWHWRSVPNTYTQRSAPVTLAEMPRLLPEDAIGTFDGTTWEADMIMEWDLLVAGFEPLADLAKGGLTIRPGSPETIDGSRVDVVQALAADVPMIPFTSETSILLDQASHLVRGYRLNVRGRHPENGKEFSVTMRSKYDVLDTQPRFTEADFVFTPPRGARKTGDAR